jgi:hypothetical protein
MPFEQVALLHANLVPAATLGGGSWLAGLPLANLKTTNPAQRARSTSASTTHTKVLIDHGAPVSLRVVWPAWHNLSAAAQLRVLRGTTSGGSEVLATTLADAWSIAPTGGRNGEVYGAPVVLPVHTAARYTTLEISDATNPAGYVELGQLLAGDVQIFTRGPSVGLQHGLRDYSTVAEAESGATWATERRTARSVSMVLDMIDDTEADALQDIRQAIGTHAQAIYLSSLTDRPHLQRYGFVGRVQELSPIDYPYARYRSLPLKLTEW